MVMGKCGQVVVLPGGNEGAGYGKFAGFKLKDAYFLLL